MEEKKTIKISLSTFFLILTIIAIGAMGFFIYKLNDDKTKEIEQANELRKKISVLESENNTLKQKESTYTQNATNQVANKNNVEEKTIETTNVNNCSSVKGIYKAEATDPRGDKGEVQLTLNEDGTFAYYYVPNFETHYEGYYTIDGNNIILHAILGCGNDIGAGMIDETIKIEYNKDNVVDNDKLNITLKKSSDKLPESNANLLYQSIKYRIKENVIQ